MIYILIYLNLLLDTVLQFSQLGHGTVVQPASIKIVFGCKQQAKQWSRTHQLGFITAVSWSTQNAESHW